MNFLRTTIAVSALALGLTGSAFAQDHRDDHQDNRGGNMQHDDHQNQNPGAYVQHKEWRKGYHMNQGDWGRGQQVDWNSHHLARPRAGYEWREVDGNYVQAAIATGIIASVIAISASR